MHRVQASQDLYGLPDSPPLATDDDNAVETPAAAGNSHYSPESPPPSQPPPSPKRDLRTSPDNSTPPEEYDFWT
jgi:hypothetical protein